MFKSTDELYDKAHKKAVERKQAEDALKCFVTTDASIEEIRETVELWALSTGWVSFERKLGLGTFVLGHFRYFGAGAPIACISTLYKEEGIEIEFNVKLPIMGLGGVAEDGARASKRFANAVGHELSKRGYRVEPALLAQGPGITAEQAHSSYTLYTRIGWTLCILGVVLGVAIGLLTWNPAIGVGIWGYMWLSASIAEIYRVRTIGMTGKYVIPLICLWAFGALACTIVGVGTALGYGS